MARVGGLQDISLSPPYIFDDITSLRHSRNR